MADDMKHIAIIDLGTNTFHLLITEINGTVVPGNICKKTIPVKLGHNGINQGFIHSDAFLRGIKALENFHQLIIQHKVNQVKAMATAAIRNASNGDDFIAEVKKKTGIEIEIIDGETEACLIYAGVRKAVKLGTETGLIMDIGGGSVEFILCNSTEIFWKRSFPLGAAKMMDQFHHSDPVSAQDVQLFTDHLDETLPELINQCIQYQPTKLIGSAGAFETFEELVRRRFHSEEKEKNLPARQINLDHFNVIASLLLQSTHEERSEMPGLVALRVDMIVVATLLAQFIINRLSIKKIIISEYSLKEGILFDLLSRKEI